MYAHVATYIRVEVHNLENLQLSPYILCMCLYLKTKKTLLVCSH